MSDAHLVQGFSGTMRGSISAPFETSFPLGWDAPMLLVPIIIATCCHGTYSDYGTGFVSATGVWWGASVPASYTLVQPPPGSVVLAAGSTTFEMAFDIDLFMSSPTAIPGITALAIYIGVFSLDSAMDPQSGSYALVASSIAGTLPTYNPTGNTERSTYIDVTPGSGVVNSMVINSETRSVFDVTPSQRTALLSDEPPTGTMTALLNGESVIIGRAHPKNSIM